MVQLMEVLEALFEERIGIWLDHPAGVCDEDAAACECIYCMLRKVVEYVTANVPDRHPYDLYLAGECEALLHGQGKGVPGKADGYLYRIHPELLAGPSPKSWLKDVEFDQDSGRVLSPRVDEWTPMSAYYTGPLVEAPCDTTFWTKWEELDRAADLLSADRFVEARLMLGTPEAFSKHTLLRMPAEKAADKITVPFELDALSFRPFRPNRFSETCVHGTTLDLRNLKELKPGVAEYIVRGVSVEDVEFVNLYWSKDDMSKAKTRRLGSGEDRPSAPSLCREQELNESLYAYAKRYREELRLEGGMGEA